MATTKKRTNTASLANHDMAILEVWYEHLASTTSTTPRLVVFVPTIEVCHPDVLRDFLHITRYLFLEIYSIPFTISDPVHAWSSLYIRRLPLVFVFGTGTSSRILHTMLPMTTRTKLGVRVFQLESSAGTFESVITGVRALGEPCRCFALVTQAPL